MTTEQGTPQSDEVRVDAFVGLQPLDARGCDVAMGFSISGRFQTTMALTPDAAEWLAGELVSKAREARAQSASPLATPIRKIVIPGR